VEAQEFGHYRLERLIGSGGMGDVYQAVDLERDRVVALKLLHPQFSANDEYVTRFRRESRMAARLREPHIIPIHDFGEIERRLFIDMRLVDDGRTIDDLLREEGALDPARAVNLIRQVADALDAAHADGLVHRDVKPSNVLVTEREFVYVMDFGIAHAVGHTATGPTLSGTTVGTLAYMAPERFTSRSPDHRADVYALACLLFQTLTGRTPFPGQDLPALMYSHIQELPPAPSAERTGMPAALDAVVGKGMAKEPGDRFPTAGHLADAAEAAVAGTERIVVTPDEEPGPPPAPPAPKPPPLPPYPSAPRRGAWLRRRRSQVVLVLAALAVVVLVALVGVLIARSGQDSSPALPDLVAPLPAPPARPAPPPVPLSLATPTATGTVATPPQPGYVAVAPGARTAWVTSIGARTVTVLDLATRTPVATIPIPEAPPRYVAFSADGSRAFVSAYPDDDSVNVVAVVDTRTNAVTATIPVDKRPYALAVAPDQRTLWVPSHDTAQIDLVDIATSTITRRVPVAPNPHWVAFDGSRAYVVDHESSLVTVLDVGTAATLATIPVGPSPHSLAVSPDGTRIAVAVYDGNAVAMIDPASNRVTATVPVGQHPQYVSWAPDGKHVYTADVDSGTVSVVDAITNQVSATVPVGGSPTAVATITPPGTTAVVSLLDDSRLAFLTVGR
jgi:YVTN family beta-propeller protein